MEVYGSFAIASAVMSPQLMTEALMYPTQGVSILVGSKNVMSVNVPVFDFGRRGITNIYPYALPAPPASWTAPSKLSEVFPRMLELAAKEKQADLVAGDRKRPVAGSTPWNMADPRLSETIPSTSGWSGENERGNQTRLMKVKDMMLEAAIKEKRHQTEQALNEYHS